MKSSKLPCMKGPHVIISTTITPELWKLAKEKGIRWSDAVRRGIIYLSKGDRFQADMEIQKEKIMKLSNLVQEHIHRVAELEEEKKELRKKMDAFDHKLRGKEVEILGQEITEEEIKKKRLEKQQEKTI